MVPISAPATPRTIERSGPGFRVHFGSHSVYGRRVLLACGVQDHLPDLAGAEEAVLPTPRGIVMHSVKFALHRPEFLDALMRGEQSPP